ncbi:MAG: glucose-6-phosphate isomerase family protein [Anaerolineales bacterium]|jgi:glucose-6-phosphate isomerase
MKTTEICNTPVSVTLDIQSGIFEPCPEVTQRRVSDLLKMFSDREAAQRIISSGDRLVYEIRYHPFLTSRSDMALGVTRLLPGKVGDEYHMTKGHFHEREDQPEIYYCVNGEGYLLMETAEGDFQAAAWKPGVITHIPPQYAHRVVNTGSGLLVFVASYHLSAGHDYDLVERRGFSQIVVERDGHPALVDNPRR